MTYIKFLLTGVFFGIVIAKAEIISWYRIYEMFQLDSFHMYGIIGSAVVIGILIIQYLKRAQSKDMHGELISIPPKNKSVSRYMFGGIIFGLGWALVGACPGPMFVLVGYGYLSVFYVIIGAIAGTYLYGYLRPRLPH